MSKDTQQEYKNAGFTIVELLIVIMVIAVLAAITTFGFSTIRQRAEASRVVDEAANWKKILQRYSVEIGEHVGGDNAIADACLDDVSGAEQGINSGYCGAWITGPSGQAMKFNNQQSTLQCLRRCALSMGNYRREKHKLPPCLKTQVDGNYTL